MFKMEREYQKPEVEVVELVTEEITTEGGLEGDTGAGSNNYFQ